MFGPLTAAQQRPVSPDLGPEAILKAVDAYRGSIEDLDRSVTVAPAAFAQGWKKLAAEMAACGLQPGDRLVMAVGNGPLFPAALAAILSRGGTPLLLHAETPPAELKRTALRIGARFVVWDDLDERSDRSAQFNPKTLGGDDWTRILWAEVDSTDPAFEQPRLSLPGVPLHPTSGSTGEPKVAARPGFCAMEEARHYVETLEINAKDVLLAVPPMSHAYAYGMCTMVPLLTGASLVTMRRFNPTLIQRALGELNVTIFPAVPAMLDVLLISAGDRLAGAPRCVLSAGSPLPERTAHEFQKRSGTVVRSLYGTTETGGIAIATGVGDAIGGCVGRPMDGVSVEIRSLAGGSHLGEGVGRVHVQSSSMMAGYLSHERLDMSAIEDGWFATGDLGRVDPSGAVHLKGRETDVINISGLKVIPGEVEEVVATLSGVTEVKVYAGRRKNGEQFVKAAVFAPGLDVAQIQAHCEQHLVYYKRLETVTLLAQALPKSPAGKILRDQLP